MTQSYQAVVISPVADLLFQPMGELKKNYKKGYSYAHLPISGVSGSPHACPRAHQLRANDTVDIIEERDDEVRVRVPHCFYLRHDGNIPQQCYWMRKKDLIPQEELSCCSSEQSCVPQPIVVSKPMPNAITLAEPWYDPNTKTLFCAGTRFAYEKSDNQYYYIFVFDRLQRRYISTPCSIEHCIETSSIDPREQRNNMIALARSWSANAKGFIPYVWGGCSILKRISYPQFSEHSIQLANGDKAQYYQWPGKAHSPKTGLDCSGLILLAAQSVGIPYFCKNSYTVEQTLRPVTPQEPLEVGDIIMCHGHVMLVADLENNTLIEARGYEHGYGKVQEIPLSEQFKDINTYEDLIAAYASKQPVKRLDKAGTIRDTVQIKLFKLM